MGNVKSKLLALIMTFIFALTNIVGLFPTLEVHAGTAQLGIEITTSNSEIMTDNYITFDIKYNVLDNSKLKEGDQIEIELTDNLKNLVPIYSKKHFKDMKKEGNKIILTIGSNSELFVQGFISLAGVVTNTTTEITEGIVKVKTKDSETKANVSILPQVTTVPGEETRAVVKFSERSSDGGLYQQVAGDSGIMHPGCSEIDFIIEVNPKLGKLKNVIVSDFLPYETDLIEDSMEIMLNKGTNGHSNYDKVKDDEFITFKDKRHFEIRFGDIDKEYRIKYKVRVKDSSHRFVNSGKVKYEEHDKPKSESSDFYVKPVNDAGALNAYKSVDKEVVGNNKQEQLVTYTIEFDGDKTFKKGEINLKDKLNKNVKYLDVIASPEFNTDYDPVTHTVSIKNSNGELQAGQRREVRIIVDFTNIKPGEIITNSVGSNTTVTKKKHIIKFKKIDSLTKNPLQGAIFKVMKKSGQNVIENIVTDENGIGQFEINTEGEYKLIEVKAPDNYEKSNKETLFTVDSSKVGEVFELPAVENIPKVRDILIRKVDSKNTNKVLSGAKFEIRSLDDKKIGEVITNEKGVGEYKSIPLGDYKLVEIEAPKGYRINKDELKLKVSESDPGIIEYNISNDIVKGSVELTKVDENKQVLSGVEFELYKLLESKEEKVGDKYTTDVNGKIKVDDLEYGKYKFVEIKTLGGHVLDATPHNFEITQDGVNIKLQAINNRIRGNILVRKVDRDSNKVLAGAKFEIRDSNKNKVAEIVTDKNGIAEYKGLPYGDYKLVEVEAPKGYKVLEGEREIKVQENEKEISFTITNELIKGEVIVEKVDKENPENKLQGAEFQIKDKGGQVISTLNTVSNGQGKISLVPGEYTLEETKAPKGYKLSQDNMNFVVTGNETEVIKLVVKNELIKGEVIVEKVDSENPNSKLIDAHFEIKNKSGKVVESIITGKDGIGHANLVPGEYTLIETKAPNGYKLDTNPRSFTVGEDVSKIVKLQVENTLQKGQVVVIKVDKDSNKKLIGAQFQIKDVTGKIVETIITGEGGTAKAILKPGKYILEEIKAAEGYILSDSKIEFEISAGEKSAITLTVENRLDTGEVIIKKVDSLDERKLLEGAEFEIRDNKGNLITTIKTGENGTASAVLVPGDYTLSETRAPRGYELSKEEKKFTIEKEQKVSKEIKVNNNIIKGNVVIKKVDKENNFKLLSGAEFQIKNQHGEIVQTITTGENGKAKASLTPGKYTLVETKAPKGYKLSKEIKEFEIVLGQTLELEIFFENQIEDGNLIINKVDSKDKRFLEGAIFRIKNKQGEIIGTIITNKDGYEKISLKPGEYVFTEIEAPKGYEKSNKEEKVIIKPQEDTNIQFENNKIEIIEPNKPEEPKDPKEEKQPDKPKEPNKPNKPGEKEKPQDPKDSKDPNQPENKIGIPKVLNKILPKTAEEIPLFNYLAGILLMVLGVFIRKKK
ncbi:MSCRAMM family protein [Hathewaya histolytica]|uniref:MSCRAMM family protein n=1 Tax=Hathewaya histolytica TaxID=1498 RepID=UPI003B67C212